MSHPLLDPLPIGSLALTLKRADPRNAGLVVEILAHVGAVPEWRIEDGYRVRRIDGCQCRFKTDTLFRQLPI